MPKSKDKSKAADITAADKPAKTGKAPTKATTKKSAKKTGIKKRPAATQKDPAKTTRPRRRPARVQVSAEDISLRAYFIAERRRTMGWEGDETSDWVQAEQQLRLEAEEALRTGG